VWLQEPRLHSPLRRRFPIWDASGESWPAHPGGQLRDRRLLEFWLAFELHFEAVRRFRAGAGLRLKKLGGQCVELRFPTASSTTKTKFTPFRAAGWHARWSRVHWKIVPSYLRVDACVRSSRGGRLPKCSKRRHRAPARKEECTSPGRSLRGKPYCLQASSERSLWDFQSADGRWSDFPEGFGKLPARRREKGVRPMG